MEEGIQLVSRLEREPHLIPLHWLALEELIKECMDAVFKASDTDTKVRLSALEYRARSLRNRVTRPDN